MERAIRQSRKESMKMAILKQEETFRHQVHELHRLYRVQKLLMSDLKNTQTNHKRWNAENAADNTGSHQSCYGHQGKRRPRRILDLELPAEEYIRTCDRDVMLEIEQDSEVELTLATGSSRKNREEAASYTCDSGASFSSSSTESGGVKSEGHGWGLLRVPDIKLNNQIDRKNEFGVENQPPWLFPCLSLKMA